MAAASSSRYAFDICSASSAHCTRDGDRWDIQRCPQGFDTAENCTTTTAWLSAAEIEATG